MALYGYARASSLSQSTEIQEQKLYEVGCSVVRKEKISGASTEGRDELKTLLEFITEGDTLVVVRLDRLGRSTRDVLNIVHALDQKKAFLRVLDRNIDTSKPEGKLILTVLSMVSEMELSFIKERQKAGIERAKTKGVYKGRPSSIDHEKLLQLKRNGHGATAIAKELGCTRSAVYKALNRLK
ncbi:recombinase family protein [Marivivens marinus]|uniref:recombinase family protein n=1 Tax=Marivivens marinus TaxID=3110173 RepID=UPI003B8460EC